MNRSDVAITVSPGNAGTRGHRALPALVVAFMLLLAFPGCGRGGDGTATERKPGTAQTQAERGPVRVTVVVEPSPARLSDLPKLTLTVDYERGVTVQKPAFGTSLGDFLVRDFREPLPRVRGEREILQQIYTLEPLRTGKIPLLPITVAFTDARPQGDGKEHTVETEALTVEVASVAADEMPSLAALRPAAEPVPLPRPASLLWWWLPALLAAAAAGGLVWWWRRRQAAFAAVQVVSPREQAYLELQHLLEQGLAESNVKLFYVELTAIVRRYIERTTGIHAPEQTTEEFLSEIGRQRVFGGEEGRRLREFLESADLVKFAAHHPRAADIEESFRRAQVFVGFQAMEAAA